MRKGYYPTQSSVFSLRTQSYLHPLETLYILAYGNYKGMKITKVEH